MDINKKQEETVSSCFYFEFIQPQMIKTFKLLLIGCSENYMLIIIAKFTAENVKSAGVLGIFLYLYAKGCFVGFLKL